LGMEMLKRVEADLAEIALVEQAPAMEGRQMVMGACHGFRGWSPG